MIIIIDCRSRVTQTSKEDYDPMEMKLAVSNRRRFTANGSGYRLSSPLIQRNNQVHMYNTTVTYRELTFQTMEDRKSLTWFGLLTLFDKVDF